MVGLDLHASGHCRCSIHIYKTHKTQVCKNMLTFLTPESPNFQSFLVLPGVLNENPANININYIMYRVLKHKCLRNEFIRLKYCKVK